MKNRTPLENITTIRLHEPIVSMESDNRSGVHLFVGKKHVQNTPACTHPHNEIPADTKEPRTEATIDINYKGKGTRLVEFLVGTRDL